MPTEANPPNGSSNPTSEAARQHWTFRGYALQTAEFNAAMIELYRGEIERSTVWRTRLDHTSNWAVAITASSITLVFAGPAIPHLLIILGTLLVTWFLSIEARRYRYYELWSSRVRLMETDYFAAMLVPPFAPSSDWAESLAHTLLQPEFPISQWEALGRRFRRNYFWLYVILAGAWLLRVWLYPAPATTWAELTARAAIGPINGQWVLAVGVLFNLVLLLVGLLTAGMRRASGEVLPKYGEFPFISPLLSAVQGSQATAGTTDGNEGLLQRRRQLLVFVVSAKPPKIAERVLREMKRGVTALHGAGAYTGQERDVLMLAVTVTEMAHLKALIKMEDPNAFVIVAPLLEVLGRGFRPLAVPG